MSDGGYTIACRDSTIGRAQVTTVRLGEDGRAVLIAPRPAGTFDVDEVTQLIDALVAVRRELMQEAQSS